MLIKMITVLPYFRVLILMVLFVIMTSVITCKNHQKEDQIDPTDMLNFDPVNLKMSKKNFDETESIVLPQKDEEIEQLLDIDGINPTLNNVNSIISSSCSDAVRMHSEATALLRQYVMTLAHNLETQIGSITPESINLRLKVSIHDIHKLKSFGEETLSDVHDIHEVLTHMIQFAAKVETKETIFYWLEEKLGLSTQNLQLSLTIIFSLMLLIKMIQNFVFTMRQMFVAFFIISVGFTWITMYQEDVAVQEKVLQQKYSDVCQSPEQQSILERLTVSVTSLFKFTDDKCQEYYKAAYVSSLLKVTPLEAVAHAVVKTLVSPVGIIGSAISTFLSSTLKDLPVQYQFCVLVFIGIFCVIVTFIICGYEVRSIFFSIQRPSRGEYYQQVESSQNQARLPALSSTNHTVQLVSQGSLTRSHLQSESQGRLTKHSQPQISIALQILDSPAMIMASQSTNADTGQERTQEDHAAEAAPDDLCEQLSQQEIRTDIDLAAEAAPDDLCEQLSQQEIRTDIDLAAEAAPDDLCEQLSQQEIRTDIDLATLRHKSQLTHKTKLTDYSELTYGCCGDSKTSDNIQKENSSQVDH